VRGESYLELEDPAVQSLLFPLEPCLAALHATFPESTDFCFQSLSLLFEPFFEVAPDAFRDQNLFLARFQVTPRLRQTTFRPLQNSFLVQEFRGQAVYERFCGSPLYQQRGTMEGDGQSELDGGTMVTFETCKL